MIHKSWLTNETQTHITLQKQVVVKPFGDAMTTTAACICGVSLLSPRNSDGDDRAASPGWGGTAPSKSLIGRHWLETETTDHIDTRSRNGNKQRAITAVTHGACQRLSPDSEPRNWLDHVREGLNPPFNALENR